MFKIGDKVVCVKSHSQGIFKKDSIYTVLAIKQNHCKCSPYSIDIGIRDSGYYVIEYCPVCLFAQPWHPVWWVNPINFRKLEDTFATETLERISYEVEQEERLIGITAFNYWKIDILPTKPQKLTEALIILRIVAMQNRQQLNKLSNFKYCKHIIEKSILEN